MEQMQTASSCYKTNVALFKPPSNQPSEYLLAGSAARTGKPYGRSCNKDGEEFSLSMSTDAAEESDDHFQEMRISHQ